MAILRWRDFAGREQLIRRLVIRASTELIEEIYHRIVADSMVDPEAKPAARPWEQIMERAVKEEVLTVEEARLLLDDPWEKAA